MEQNRRSYGTIFRYCWLAFAVLNLIGSFKLGPGGIEFKGLYHMVVAMMIGAPIQSFIPAIIIWLVVREKSSDNDREFQERLATIKKIGTNIDAQSGHKKENDQS